MGLVDWFKQKFNVGGLKVRLVEVQPITEEEGLCIGKVEYTTQVAPIIGKTTCRLICETTTAGGDSERKERSTLGEETVLVGVAIDEPGTTTEDFSFRYDFRSWLEKQGGLLAASSQIAKLAQGPSGGTRFKSYFVEIEVSIPGVWFGPSDRKEVQVNLAR